MPDFLRITVVTTGDDLEAQFNSAEPMKVVFNRALAEVGGGPDREQFTLEYEDEELGLDQRIADVAERFGWGDEVTLELVPRPVVIGQ